MKAFLFLSLLSFTAYAACDYGSPEKSKEYKCEKNFSCLETVVRDPLGSLDEIDSLVDYSRKNQCNDELKMTELFANLIWENDKDHELQINNSDRGINTKAELPVIPDAPSESASRTQRQ